MLKKDEVLQVINAAGGCDGETDWDNGYDYAIGVAYSDVKCMDSIKTIPELLEDIKEKICDQYCKYPEKYGTELEELDELYENHCNDCPLKYL